MHKIIIIITTWQTSPEDDTTAFSKIKNTVKCALRQQKSCRHAIRCICTANVSATYGQWTQSPSNRVVSHVVKTVHALKNNLKYYKLYKQLKKFASSASHTHTHIHTLHSALHLLFYLLSPLKCK